MTFTDAWLIALQWLAVIAAGPLLFTAIRWRTDPERPWVARAAGFVLLAATCVTLVGVMVWTIAHPGGTA